MAVAGVCACAWSYRVVVLLLLLGSALAGLCLSLVLAPAPERVYSPIPFRDADIRVFIPEDRNSTDHNISGSSPASIRASQQPGLVRLVALKHIAGRRRGNEDHDSRATLDSYQKAGDVVASWRAIDARRIAPLSVEEGDHVHRISKRLVVDQRRTLRTSKPYPCNLPSPTSCTPPASNCCGTTCANFATNPNHCGRCGHICKPDRACCNGKCRRLATDEKNCGRCDSRCAIGTRCLYGLCGY